MGWKGTLRTLAAAQRRSERAARQHHKELSNRHKQFEKMAELERASYEVEVYENGLEVLSSIHKDGGEVWDWKGIQASEPPSKPMTLHLHEEAAKAQLKSFKSGIIDKLLKRTEAKREELAKSVATGHQLDEQEYQEALKAYEQELSEWEATLAIANRILASDHEAYLQAIKQIDPFSEISELGSSIEFYAYNASHVEAILRVNSEEVIPREVKSLLKNGKLSIKEMPKAKFFELYQDYICGCVLRIAREIFALLPIEMAIVTALGKVLNTKTGHLEESPILSVAIPRTTLLRFNFESLDPSDSMSNFVHRMNFKKTVGFSIVERISVSDLKSDKSETKQTAA